MSVNFRKPMNPVVGHNVIINPLARMLPLKVWQSQVYRLAEKHPPGLEDGFTPIWECVTFVMPARTTDQARVSVQRDFHLIAVSATSTLGPGNGNGTFRFQIYDEKKKWKLTDRGVQFAVGTGGGSPATLPLFLRHPYPLTEKDAQLLVVCQNQDTSVNTNQVQIVLYGQARRFNFPA